MKSFVYSPFERSNDPMGYVGGSVATGRASLISEFRGENLDIEATQNRMTNVSNGSRGKSQRRRNRKRHFWLGRS